MSGGHFNYNQYHIENIADEIEGIIDNNRYDFSEETLNRFAEGLTILKMAYIYTRRIDWLLSDDDGEEEFHRRLVDDIKASKILFFGPELLEALELVVSTHENGGWPSAAIVVARAAIAKARGET